MRKYFLPILLICFWGCEDNNALELVYSSITDGGILEENSGVLLRFSEQIPSDIFDAESIENYGDLLVLVLGNGDAPGTSQIVDGPDYMSIINNSNFITLNNQPQTFIYNSKNNSCLLVSETTVFYPDGTGGGFVPNQINNQLKIGDEKIDFTLEQNSSVNIVPNPFVQSTIFSENENHLNLTFTNVSSKIIDIYPVDNEAHIRRLIHNEDNNASWDLRDYNNQEVSSGFYIYRVGTDTLDNGYLNYSTIGYFSITLADE